MRLPMHRGIHRGKGREICWTPMPRAIPIPRGGPIHTYLYTWVGYRCLYLNRYRSGKSAAYLYIYIYLQTGHR